MALAGSGRFTAVPRLGKSRQVFLPQSFSINGKVVQPFPGVESGIVAIVEAKAHGIRSDRLDTGDVYLLFADLKYFLTWPMAAYFGGGRVHPQVLDRQLVVGAVIKRDLEDPRLLVQFYFGRTYNVLLHDDSVLRWAAMPARGTMVRRIFVSATPQRVCNGNQIVILMV
jgi:hypothetical protein